MNSKLHVGLKDHPNQCCASDIRGLCMVDKEVDPVLV